MANIALTNGVKWASSSVVHQTLTIGGINGANLLASGKAATFGSGTTYTATQDCWICMYWSTNMGSVKVNGGNIWFGQSQNWQSYWFPLRSGQTVTIGSNGQLGPNGTDNCVYVYGIKR